MMIPSPDAALGDDIGRSATNATKTTKSLISSFWLRWDIVFSEWQFVIGMNAVAHRVNDSRGNENQQFFYHWLSGFICNLHIRWH